MRGMKRPVSKQRRMTQAMVPVRHEPINRRSANQNAHVITPHGRIQSSRKGRRG